MSERHESHDQRSRDHRSHDHRADRHDPHHRPAGHERQVDRDISLRGIGYTVLGLAVGTLLAMVAMWWMYESMLSGAQAHQPEPSPLAAARQPVLPPGPRLQASPNRDLAQFRAHENARLSSYGWKDEASGTVHIPISRAMQVVAEAGLDGAHAALSMAPDKTAGDDLQATDAGALPAGGVAAPVVGAQDPTPQPSSETATPAAPVGEGAGTGTRPQI